MAHNIFRSIFITLTLAVIGTLAARDSKLIKGNYAMMHEFPSVVAIYKNDIFHCGGSLVSKDTVITAAHCIHSILEDENNYATVVTGANDFLQGGEVHTVSRYYYHYEWNKQITDNKENLPWNYDIGAIKLADPVEFSSVQRPILLPDEPPSPNTKATVVGWGITEDKTLSRFLRKLEIDLLPPEKCQGELEQTIQEHHICGFKEVGAGTCLGDSGSPLFAGNVQIGTVSGGLGCAGVKPDIYVSTYYTRKFIDFVIQEPVYTYV
ncbi:hypodermin-A-like [Prorops nasuta]|uniref:hypodermin-A-like n=1 Tax=Prorops nasuta TaxID=863751 RepID=UPI0034CEB545